MSRLGRALIKALKPKRPFNLNPKKLWEKLYLSDRLDWAFNVYYSIIKFFKNIIKVIKFIPVVWKFENWDYNYILEFNYKLHKELYKGLYEQGHHQPSPRHKRALKTIIELYRRLYNENYNAGVEKELTRLYGSDDFYFETIPGAVKKTLGLKMKSKREDRLSPKELNLYRKKVNELYKHAEYLQKQDAELLGKLIAKYHRHFWD